MLDLFTNDIMYSIMFIAVVLLHIMCGLALTFLKIAEGMDKPLHEVDPENIHPLVAIRAMNISLRLLLTIITIDSIIYLYTVFS